MTKNILTSIDGNVATITLNRPEVHNAFDDTMIQELIHALETFAADKTAHLLILNANGDNFCAGADLKWMKKIANYSEAENIADAKQLAKLLQTLYDIEIPTIAFCQGKTFGGGLGLLACCDYVVAHLGASFCFSEVSLGLTPSTICPYIIKAIGSHQTKRFFLSAEVINPRIAKDLGLVHELTCHLDIAQQATINHFSRNSLPAQIEAKRLVKQISSITNNDDILEITSKHIAKMRASIDAQTRLKKFFETRKA